MQFGGSESEGEGDSHGLIQRSLAWTHGCWEQLFLIFHVGVLLPTHFDVWCFFFWGGEEIPVTIVDCLKALCNFYAFHLISLNFACFVLLARHLVDLQPRYAYTTWAPKAKFCLQDQAAWNISRAASPKRGSQGLGRCTLSPRIGSKPYLINGCGHTDLYWLLEAFTLLYWGSRCLSQLQLSGMKLAWFS